MIFIKDFFNYEIFFNTICKEERILFKRFYFISFCFKISQKNKAPL